MNVIIAYCIAWGAAIVLAAVIGYLGSRGPRNPFKQ